MNWLRKGEVLQKYDTNGAIWAVLLRWQTVGSVTDEKSSYGVANRRDACTMVRFTRANKDIPGESRSHEILHIYHRA